MTVKAMEKVLGMVLALVGLLVLVLELVGKGYHRRNGDAASPTEQRSN